MTFNFILSPSLASPYAPRGPISVPTAAVRLIREAAEQLRERSPPQTTEVSGKVVRLNSPFVPSDLFHPEGREIDVVWESATYGKVKVWVRLSPDDYQQAISAHEQGREVIVGGVFTPRGKRGFVIDDSSSFSLGGVVRLQTRRLHSIRTRWSHPHSRPESSRISLKALSDGCRHQGTAG